MGLIQRDVSLGIVTDLLWDEHTEELHVKRSQDVESVLDRNKAIKASGWDGYNNDRSFKAVAEIPATIVEQWAREGVEWWNPEHSAALLKKMEDPALDGFRIGTKSAHVGHIIVTGTK